MSYLLTSQMEIKKKILTKAINDISTTLIEDDFSFITLIQKIKSKQNVMSAQLETETTTILNKYFVATKIKKGRRTLLIKEAIQLHDKRSLKKQLLLNALDRKIASKKYRTRGQRNISVASKILFAIEPDFFVPFDRYNRLGLNLIDPSYKPIYDYEEFYNAFFSNYILFCKAKDVNIQLRNCNALFREFRKLSKIDSKVAKKIITLRLFDKYLMCLGKEKCKKNN